MLKAQKQSIKNEIDKILAPLGYTFRWATSRDQSGWNGLHSSYTKTIILRANAGPGTLAHELAHMEQHQTLGISRCHSSKHSTLEQKQLADNHYQIQLKWVEQLKQIGLYQRYNAVFA